MSIHWCVCDMDGTLLNFDSRISNENIDAIHQLQSAGVKVILATGRSHLHIKDAVYRLGLQGPLICCNGGMILGNDGETMIYSKTMNSDVTRKLIEYCLEAQQDMLAYTYDIIYYNNINGRVSFYHQYNDRMQQPFRIPLKIVRTPEELPLDQIIKFYLWDVDVNEQHLLNNILSSDSEFSVTSSRKGALDIMAHGVSKGQALSLLACDYGVDLSRTAVIGDNHNDVSMFGSVAMPIAVANAEEEVKRLAKHISLSNDENGVAYAIRKWILPSLKTCI